MHLKYIEMLCAPIHKSITLKHKHISLCKIILNPEDQDQRILSHNDVIVTAVMMAVARSCSQCQVRRQIFLVFC